MKRGHVWRGRADLAPQSARLNPAKVSAPVARCPACGKWGYCSRQVVKRAAVRIYPGSRMRFYQCGPLWHMTSQDAETAAQHRERQAGPEDAPREQ